jgi:hypothetical protein
MEKDTFIEQHNFHTIADEQKQTILFDLLPNSEFIGTVTLRAKRADATIPRRMIFDVGGKFDDTLVIEDTEFMPGMRAKLEIVEQDLRVTVSANIACEWWLTGEIEQVR